MPDKNESEAALTIALQEILADQLARIVDQIAEGIVTIDHSFWNAEREKMLASLPPLLQNAFIEGGNATAGQIFFGREVRKARIDEEVTWRLAQDAIDWIRTYSFEFIDQINTTTRAAVEAALIEFFTTEGFTLDDFVTQLAPHFGEQRAELIAITEVTRAYALGGEALAESVREQGIEFLRTWRTNRDEKVCQICGPLNGVTESPEGGFVPEGEFGPGIPLPPAHPYCRCWLTYRRIAGSMLADISV